jgi:hypothetical protein
MRLLFALALVLLAFLLVAFLLLVRPAWAATTRCTTYEERTLNRWDTMITENPGQHRTCTPHTSSRGVEVRCR